MENRSAKKVGKNQKTKSAEKTKHEAGTADLADELTKSPVLACSLNFSHSREHHHGNGIGDGGREQNTRHGDAV